MTDRLKKITGSSAISYVLSFVIPAAVMIFAAAIVKIAPFGSNGFLVSDINNQFASFYSYWCDIITSNNDFTYTFAKSLGGDMIGFSAYYLNNPFLFFLLLFPKEQISIGIYWMLVLMIGCMGLSFYALLDSTGMSGRHYLLFSTAYALSGYAMSYITLPIYFCDLIMLPLCIMGLDRFMKDRKKFILYPLSLALAIWCNYYLGYMICLYCGLYFICRYIQLDGKERTLRRFIDFCLVSLLGVLLSCFSLIPTLSSLKGQKTSSVSSVFTFNRMYSLKSLVKNLFPASFTCDLSNGAAPYIYVGIVTCIFALAFFAAKKVRIVDKITWALLVLLLILSTYISGLDAVWHGFNSPVGFSHRQAFLIAFTIIFLGAMGMREILKKEEIKAALIKKITVFAVLTGIAELTYNAASEIKVYADVQMSSQEEYASDYIRDKTIIDEIQSADSGLYRIENNSSNNINNAMKYSYNGISHNSSCESDEVKQFLARMGFRNQGVWANYGEGSTAFADSFLGIKYLISRFDGTDKPYIYAASLDDRFVFANPFALSLGFADDKDKIANTDMTAEDLFLIQNEIAGKDIFKQASYSLSLTGAAGSSEAALEDETYMAGLDETVGVKNTGSGTLSRHPDAYELYTREDGDEAYLEYNVLMPEDGNLYFYFAAPYEQDCRIYINGNLWDDYFSDYRWGIVDAGRYLSGDNVSIRLELTGDELRIFNAYFYVEDDETLAEWYTDMSDAQLSLEKITSSHLKGTVNIISDVETASDVGTASNGGTESETGTKGGKDSGKCVILTLPYEKCWNVYVDGQKTDTYKVLDALLAFDIDEGEHEIELKYSIIGK